MPYYLGEYEEHPVQGHRWHTPAGAQPGFASTDLRPDGGATPAGGGLNACLLYLPSPSLDERLTLIGLDGDDSLGVATATPIYAELGTALAPGWL